MSSFYIKSRYKLLDYFIWKKMINLYMIFHTKILLRICTSVLYSIFWNQHFIFNFLELAFYPFSYNSVKKGNYLLPNSPSPSNGSNFKRSRVRVITVFFQDFFFINNHKNNKKKSETNLITLFLRKTINTENPLLNFEI